MSINKKTPADKTPIANTAPIATDKTKQENTAAATKAGTNVTEANQQTVEVTADRAPSGKKQTCGEFIAIARVHASLETTEEGLFLLTKGDQTPFEIRGVRPGRLTVRLLSLAPGERTGLFGLWPNSKGGWVISGFHDAPDTWVHPNNSPDVDQFLLSGWLSKQSENSFVVKVGRNAGRTKGKGTYHKVTVNSPAPDTWEDGQWVDLKLQRNGTKWGLP